MQKVLNAEKDRGDGDQHAAHSDETPASYTSHRNSRQNPGAAAERHFPDDDRPWDSAAGFDCTGQMQHRHKKQHHGPEQ
jgi:hypothetical protein